MNFYTNQLISLINVKILVCWHGSNFYGACQLTMDASDAAAAAAAVADNDDSRTVTLYCPAAVGEELKDVDTPALVVDLE